MSGGRAWWVALVASLAVHALVLLLSAAWFGSGPRPTPPALRIPVGLWTAPATAALSARPLPDVSPRLAGRSAAESRPLIRAPVEASDHGAPVEPAAQVASGVLRLDSDDGAAGSGAGTALTGTQPGSNGEGDLGHIAAGLEAPGGSSETAALVHARLRAAAQRCYPQVARRLHLKGTAEVHFCVEPSGALGARELIAQSGAALLDEAALGCVVTGAWPFDPAASGRCYTVPVRFGALEAAPQLGP